MATKTSGYAVAKEDNAALCDALLKVLASYPLKERERALAALCEDPRVEKALTDHLRKNGVEPERKFSPMAKGIANYSSMSVSNGEITRPGSPSALAKRVAQSGNAGLAKSGNAQAVKA